MNPRHRRTYGRGQPQGRRPKGPPTFMGEPSPSLGKINQMNMVGLEAKIASLNEEQQRLGARLEHLQAQDPAPEEKIKALIELMGRLKALAVAAAERLAGKAERKAAREQGQL